MMRIAIATDAWYPQVNGVVRTLGATVAELDRRGYEVELITPQRFMTVPLPGYASIRLAMAPRFGVRKMLGDFDPQIVHISTEGPIGWSARSWCQAHGVPFTTAFHTRFPDYAAARTGISAERFWPIMRRFHAESHAVMVATGSLADELATRGITQTRRWSRGIDRWLFNPVGGKLAAMEDLPRPIMLNVGRVAVEKNLEAFLDADVPGTKVVVGDGPARSALSRKYPKVQFLGALTGEALTRAYAGSDVFVFPSRTDTFGLVTLEALACGLTVAAYPVEGPRDVVGPQVAGGGDVAVLDEDLATACRGALALAQNPRALTPRDFAMRHSWRACTLQFLANIAVEPDLD